VLPSASLLDQFQLLEPASRFTSNWTCGNWRREQVLEYGWMQPKKLHKKRVQPWGTTIPLVVRVWLYPFCVPSRSTTPIGRSGKWKKVRR
jgi:hypothetical protein